MIDKQRGEKKIGIIYLGGRNQSFSTPPPPRPTYLQKEDFKKFSALERTFFREKDRIFLFKRENYCVIGKREADKKWTYFFPLYK